MKKSILVQFLNGQLQVQKDLLELHIRQHGDDSVVLYSGKPPLHPEKHSRIYIRNDLRKLESALKQLEEEDCFIDTTLSLSVIVGGDLLEFHDINASDLEFVEPVEFPPKGAVELLDRISKTDIKFNNNSRVRLIGPPNGIEETRGNIGDIGIITDVSNYLVKDFFANTPEGYCYIVKSPSFVGALNHELWVHESNLELVDAV